jgi:uncharacterized protein YeaO (DUF488 family)
MMKPSKSQEDKMKTIYCERAYDAPAHKGYRVLVDRLWPRGIKKENLPLDEWLKDIAPSNELRKWFNHEVDKWPEFQKRFRKELDQHRDTLKALLKNAGKKPLVLIFAARDADHNNAVVIRDYLKAL